MTTTNANAAIQAFNDAKAAGDAATAEAKKARARRAYKPDTAADLDTEMHALNQCVTALMTLDTATQHRVMLYLARRFTPVAAAMADAVVDGEADQ